MRVHISVFVCMRNFSHESTVLFMWPQMSQLINVAVCSDGFHSTVYTVSAHVLSADECQL